MSLAEISALRPLFGGSAVLETCTFLEMSAMKLTSISNAVGSLTLLKELDLSENDISSLPPSFSKLTGLTCLSLSNNSNMAALPQELSNLTNLTTLFIYGTNLIDFISCFTTKMFLSRY